MFFQTSFKAKTFSYEPRLIQKPRKHVNFTCKNSYSYGILIENPRESECLNVYVIGGGLGACF